MISGKNVSLHSYTLWRNGGGKDGDIVISPGIHGEVVLGPLLGRGDEPADTAAHNIAEMKKAMEEAGKWETKLKESPLGITQQDFVAYYREVIALFAAWCAANDIHLPKDRN